MCYGFITYTLKINYSKFYTCECIHIVYIYMYYIYEKYQIEYMYKHIIYRISNRILILEYLLFYIYVNMYFAYLNMNEK